MVNQDRKELLDLLDPMETQDQLVQLVLTGHQELPDQKDNQVLLVSLDLMET